MFIVFLGGVVVAEPPLTSVQMLWVNLIMDTFAALALATEPPSDDLLEQPPYGRNDIIVTPVMWRNIIGQGLYQATVLVVMLFAGGDIFNLPFEDNAPFYTDGLVPTNRLIVYTMIFHTFVFMQVFNEINSRKLGAYDYNVFSGFFNNWLFISIIIVTIVVQCCMVQYGGLPVRAAPLTMTQHAICIGIGFFSLIQGFLVKAFLPVRWFARLHMKEEPMTDEEEKDAFTTNFRKSFRASHRRSTQKVNIQ
jgi:Ca2+ transporting ATPase